MHLPGVKGIKCVHPEFKSSAHKLLYHKAYTLNNRENGAYARCTAFKIVHPPLKSCMQGAGCTLSFEHCRTENIIFVIDMLILRGTPMLLVTN